MDQRLKRDSASVDKAAMPVTTRTAASAERPAAAKLSKAQALFVSSLAVEDKLLLLLKAELYEGRWDAMEQDLQDRLQGRPYIFKLASRITDDLSRIERMRAFEDEHQLDLSTIVPLDDIG